MKKKSRKKKVVVVVNQPAKQDFEFDKLLDEIAVMAGPSIIWAGIESKLEVAAVAFFWFILCKAWAVRIRRKSK